MPDAEVLSKIQEMRTFLQEKQEASYGVLQSEFEKLKTGMADIDKLVREMRRERVSSLSDQGRVIVTEGRFTGLDMIGLSIVERIVQKKYATKGHTADSSSFLETLAESRKALASSVTFDTVMAWQERGLKERRTALGTNDFNAGIIGFREDLASWTEALMEPLRRAMDSTVAGSGDELVPTLEAAELWMDVNLDSVVLPLFRQVPMPTEPYDFPLQLGDVNWYPSEQNKQTTTTDPATAKTTLASKGLTAGVPFSDELSEDAIIAIASELRRSISRNAAEVIDDVLMNADTTVQDNINADGTTISGETAGKAQWLLGWDGIIHQALIDNSSQAIDINAAVSANAVFNAILRKLGKYAAPRRRGDVVLISDVNTAIAALAITEFETVDTAGSRATLSTGEIMSVYGRPYVHTDAIALADTDGKVTSAGNSEDNGRVVAVNTSQWRVGFRRGITIESDREPGKQQNTLYISFRIALVPRGTRSSNTHTSIAYNITTVG
jgi:HK97 family phage major capsid protein